MRNRSQKTAETLLLEPTKNKEKACKPPGQTRLKKKVFGTRKQVLCPSHCKTAARKMPKRRFWNPLKRKKYSAQTMRNRSQKTAETLLLEPTKNKEKRLPQARQTFAQRKTWKPASHQAKLKKKVFGTRHAKRQNPSRFSARKPLRNRSRKNLETSLLEPTNKNKEI